VDVSATGPKTGNGTGNGNHRGVVARLASQAIHALSPQFLALIIVNMIFIGMLFWYIEGRAQHTMTIVNQLLQACLSRAN
jgi:hypothetical protein